MKVVALLENSISEGGGFNQALNAIVQMVRLAENCFEFEVLTSRLENISILEKLGIAASTFKPSFVDKIIAGLTLNELTRRILARLRLLGPLEKRLIDTGCDLVYFVAPSALPASLQCLNYIATVWDISHRDTPEFPEVRAYGEFQRREFMYQNYLDPAYAVLVDSEQLRDRIHKRYGVDTERMIVMPFAPNPMLESRHSLNMDDTMARYFLEPGYFFYPAQFWSHKNHVRIIEALALLRNIGHTEKAVFVGGDKGNLAHVRHVIQKLNLTDQVSILGFVPSEHLRALYLGCAAVVMPTYFGPTNLPPLEAWQLGKPLIYSNHLVEQTGAGAASIDPDDSESIAKAMLAVRNDQYAKDLVKNGSKQLEIISSRRIAAEKHLSELLSKFNQRMATWGP